MKRKGKIVKIENPCIVLIKDKCSERVVIGIDERAVRDALVDPITDNLPLVDAIELHWVSLETKAKVLTMDELKTLRQRNADSQTPIRESWV